MNLPQQALEQLHVAVDGALARGRAYLTACPDADGRGPMLFAMARFLVLNNQRAMQDFMEAFRAEHAVYPEADWIHRRRQLYFAEPQAMLEEARRRCAQDLELMGEIDRLHAQCHYFTGEFARAAEEYRAAIKNHPTDPEPDQTLCALIGSALKAGQIQVTRLEDPTAYYREVVAQCEHFLERYPSSNLLPHVLNLEMKGYLGLGQPREALAHLAKYDELHWKAVAGTPVELGGEAHTFSPSVRREFESYLDQMYYHYGFFHYLDGEVEATVSNFQRAIEHLSRKAEKQALMPASQVFLNRTIEELRTITSLQGRRAPALALPREAWLGEVFDLEEQLGNVVVVLFAAHGDERRSAYLRALEDLYQKRWHDGLRVVWVTYPKGFPKDEAELAAVKGRVLDQQRQLALTFPAALDLSQDWAVARSYYASIGGANVYLLDREGKLLWYKIDPTERDWAVSVRVIHRALSSPLK